MARPPSRATFLLTELTRGGWQRALDRLNLQRLASGVDQFGQGRNPYALEQALLVVLTDGTALTSPQGVVDTFSLPMHLTPGAAPTRVRASPRTS
jgi:hypothetical protein